MQLDSFQRYSVKCGGDSGNSKHENISIFSLGIRSRSTYFLNSPVCSWNINGNHKPLTNFNINLCTFLLHSYLPDNLYRIYFFLHCGSYFKYIIYNLLMLISKYIHIILDYVCTRVIEEGV